MNNRTTELRVGLAVLIGLVILIWGLIWLKGFRFQRQRYEVNVLFPNIGTLKTGDMAAVSGVDKGKVEKIQLQRGDVMVKMSLDKDVVLKADARFTVMNVGLMGERFVEVRTGYSDTLLNLREPIYGFYDTGIPEVMGMLGRGIDELRELIAALRGTVASPGYLSKVQDVIANTQKLTERLNAVVEGNQRKIGQATEDFASAAGRLKTLLETNAPKIDSTVTSAREAASRMNEITTGLDSLSHSLHSFIDKIDSQQGTLGKLVNDDRLYGEIRKAANDLDSLVLDIKKNPKKYLRIQIF